MTPTLVCPNCSTETPVDSDSTVCAGCGSRYGTAGLYSGSTGGGERVATEAEVQQEVATVLRSLGFVVTSFDQGYRPDGSTRQTVGVPDLFATHPKLSISLWVEVKRPGGKASAAQREWHRTAREAGNLVVVAESAVEVVDYLREHGAPLDDVA